MRAYIFFRHDSLFFADSVLTDSSFRYIYIALPAEMKEGEQYKIYNWYIDYGPMDEADEAFDTTETGGYYILIQGLDDITSLGGGNLEGCLRYSIGGQGTEILCWLHPDCGFAHAVMTEYDEGVEYLGDTAP